MMNGKGLLAAGGLMVVCCLAPVILLGGGAAGLLAWIGGLKPYLIPAAIVGGIVVSYYVFRRARVAAD